MTCSVSLEQSFAIEAYNELKKREISCELEFPIYGKPKLEIYDQNDLKLAHTLLRNIGLRTKKLLKVNGLGGSYQYAKGTSEDGTEVRVWANDVFDGCRVVYDEVEVPEQTIPAHTEKKARIICNGNGGV